MIWNEQRKIVATVVTDLGIAIMVTGVRTPVLANLDGLNNAPGLSWLTNGRLVPIGFVVGIGRNAMAVRWLRGLV